MKDIQMITERTFFFHDMAYNGFLLHSFSASIFLYFHFSFWYCIQYTHIFSQSFLPFPPGRLYFSLHYFLPSTCTILVPISSTIIDTYYVHTFSHIVKFLLNDHVLASGLKNYIWSVPKVIYFMGIGNKLLRPGNKDINGVVTLILLLSKQWSLDHSECNRDNFHMVLVAEFYCIPKCLCHIWMFSEHIDKAVHSTNSPRTSKTKC